jgi:hypothetical protein
MRSIWAAFRASIEPMGLKAFDVAEATVGLHDLHREILAEDAEPDDDLLATFRAMLGQPGD